IGHVHVRDHREHAYDLGPLFSGDRATCDTYPLSLHDALPILGPGGGRRRSSSPFQRGRACSTSRRERGGWRRRSGPGYRREVERSEEHTSELQSRGHLVCRLLLEKKNRIVALDVLEREGRGIA